MSKKLFLIFFVFIIVGCASVSTNRSDKKDNPFGVLVFLPWNDDWNDYMYPPDKALRAMDLIKDSGIGWVRMDFSRTKIQPQNEEGYNFEDFDWLVHELRRRQIKIVGILGYSPGWAAADGKSWNSPPKDIGSFARYVAQTVKRYQGAVNDWEIWNEPNLSNYWQPQDDMVLYAQLLKASYQAAKSVNPDCRILNGGLVIQSPGDYEKFYAKGMNRFLDIFNVHLFVGATGVVNIDEKLVGNAENIHAVMAQFGDEHKPLWITEIGFPGVPETVKKAELKFRYKPGERQQAGLLTKAFRAVVESGKVDKIFWAFFQDTKNSFPDGADYLGLIRSDFTPKPSYEAYKELSKDLKWK